jgi:hypothetical protein
MVDTITPVVHGGSRRSWARVLALHALGATASASVMGAALGLAGTLLGAPWGTTGATIVVVVAVAYAAREAFGFPVPIPDARRQVPQWWRETFSSETAAALYGLGLGLGFATHLRHGTLVAVAGAVVAGGDPAVGAVAMGAFGLARSIAVGSTWRAVDPPAARRLARWLERTAIGPWPRIVNGTALAAVAAGVLAAVDQTTTGTVGIVPTVVLAGTFGLAAATKLRRPRGWRSVVDAHGLPAPVAATVAAAVPLAEGAVPGLVVGGAIHAGATLAAGLLVAFSAALVRHRRRSGDRVPCGCFGGSRSRSLRLLLARNALLIVVAIAAARGPNGLDPVLVPDAAELVPAVLVAVGLGVLIAMLRRTAALLRDARPLTGRVEG